jgi:peptidoglycan/LPS O-acetylase OafA/YrhL
LGILRLLLALSVLVGHLPGAELPVLHGTGGIVAVESFFMVSGFYMALVLRRTYAHSARRFWANRALRIFPTYWACAAVGLLIFGPAAWLAGLAALPAPAGALVGLSNVTIVGQDLTLFATTQGGTLAFTPNFWNDPAPLWGFLLVPQAWSLSLELVFYLLAPGLVRLRSRTLVLIVIGSIALRLALGWAGLTNDPWSYRVMPVELGLFVGGILAFRLYESERARIAPGLALGIILALASGMDGPIGAILPPWAFYGLIAILLPSLFGWSGRGARLLGDLSYPVYLGQSIVIPLAPTGPLHAVWAIALTMLFATVVRVVIEIPVGRLRDSVRGRPDRDRHDTNRALHGIAERGAP